MEPLTCGERDYLFDRYGKAVESYQSVVLELDQLAFSDHRYYYSALLKTADAAKEYLHQCRDEYQKHCSRHSCQTMFTSAAA